MKVRASNVVINLGSCVHGGRILSAENRPEPGKLFAKDEIFESHITEAIQRWWRGGPPEVAASKPIEEFTPAADCAGAPRDVHVPFSQETREVILCEARITVCGREVWLDCGQTDLRDALALLSQQTQSGFVTIRGTQLNRYLGRESTNHIGKPLADLCARIAESMAEVGVACGREDVICNKGGYHFREWVRVRIVGDWATALNIESDVAQNSATLGEAERDATGSAFNDRQKWILAQIGEGARLQLKDVVAHFRSQCARSTINRDLKDLRERRIIKTDESGAYVRP